MKKILVVDDSETIRLQVSRALENAGFEVVEASDGVEGLEKAAADNFSLVLLDVNMPRMGGLDMLEKLRAEAKTEKTPVLVLTTEAQQSMIARAKKAGAAGWIIKPVKMDLLVDTVGKLATQEAV
jgi:two-component system chemotaxis response regulator CheY